MWLMLISLYLVIREVEEEKLVWGAKEKNDTKKVEIGDGERAGKISITIYEADDEENPILGKEDGEFGRVPRAHRGFL